MHANSFVFANHFSFYSILFNVKYRLLSIYTKHEAVHPLLLYCARNRYVCPNTDVNMLQLLDSLSF
jgi:hypothetical protein